MFMSNYLKLLAFSSLSLSLFFLFSCKEDTTIEDTEVFPIEYSMDYQTVIGKPWNITLLQTKDLQEIQLIVHDSLVKTWKNTSTDKINETLDIAWAGLGKKGVTIKIKDKEGNELSENQVIHVLSDVIPEELIAETKELYTHNIQDFTQGLEIVDGILYESTGDPDHKGATRILQKNITSGTTINEQPLEGNYFGEGITILNNQLFQITWTSQKCFIYDAKTLVRQAESFNYTGEGWGLTNDGTSIIMSDGSERIYFRDPKTFRVQKTISVCDNKGVVKNLNELEYVDGLIYANVWMTSKIVVFEATSGKVIKTIDCSEFEAKAKGGGDVLNGIAYNHTTNKFYLTGKYWPYLGLVEFKAIP